MIKNKKKVNIYLAIAVSILIVVSALSYVMLVYMQDSTENEDETTLKEIDDRISPLTNQAIFLEIHRVRKKGIIDVMENSGLKLFNNWLNTEDIKVDSKNDLQKLRFRNMLDGMRPGFGWDDKPSYKYIATLDGYEFKSRQTLNQWDTGYINQQIFRNVEEEQQTTEIEFKIIENKEVKKLIGKTTIEDEMDCFKVIYDFRNGYWTGSDYLNDSDGYGHYDGDNYEIWFSLYQTSSDMDIIPWWVEVNVLGTDPTVDDSKLDPDQDGIPTEWEWKWGYDPFTWDNHTFLDPDQDGLQNVEEYFMSKWLADPFHPEIYIEVDYMDQTPKKPFNRDGWDGWEHVFYEESQQMLIERFNEHGISMHVDDGRMGGGGEILPFGREGGVYNQEVGVVGGFYANNFADERKGIFRYTVITYGGGWCHPQDSNHYYDCITTPHNLKFFQNHLGLSVTERTKRIGQAIQMLHELGHSLGMLLTHSGGVDNVSSRNGFPPDYPWYDYVSVMNYDYFWLRYFDYSDGSHGPNDTDDWAVIDLTFFQRPSEEMEGIGFDY